MEGNDFVEVGGKLVGCLGAERAVPVEVAEEATPVGAAFGRLDDKRIVLVGRENGDVPVNRAEAERPADCPR